MFKLFPVKADKTPAMSGWQEAATTDPEKLKLWSELYKGQLAWWGIPTGQANGILVLDVDTGAKDGKNGFETLKGRELPPTMTQKTPSGGAHYIYKYPSNGRRYGNRVKFLPGLDTRGDGGYIVYYGTDATPIADAPSWLLDEAQAKTFDHTGQVVRISPSIAQGIIEKCLETIREAPEGERNNTLNVEAFKVGQLVASQSITRAFANEQLSLAAKECGLNPFEAKATIDSALDGGAKKPLIDPFQAGAPIASISMPAPPAPVGRWTPAALTREAMMDVSKLRKPQLFQDWSTEDITLISADGGTGKTTLLMFESVCLALGERFLGFDCKKAGRTLFITGEDSEAKLAARLGVIVKHMNLSDDQIETVRNSIFIKKDNDLCLITKDKLGFLHPNQDALRKLYEAIDDINPKMIVFDPISMFWGRESELNDMAKAVSKFMGELVDRAHAAVVMVNHIGKDSSRTKDMTQFAGRGGSGLPSHARVGRVMREINSEEFLELTGEELGAEQNAILCNINKFSDGSPLYNKPFLIVRDGFMFSRKALSKQKEREVEREMSDVERVFTYVKDERRENRFPTPKIVVGHFVTCGDPLPKTRVEIALQKLQYQGHLGEKIRLVENPDVTIRDKAFIVTDQEGRET